MKSVEEIVDLLAGLEKTSRVYLGCDSVRYRRDNANWARYATVAIVHMNGKNGCRVFHNISHEPDYDAKKNRPKVRMMNEVAKVCKGAPSEPPSGTTGCHSSPQAGKPPAQPASS